MDEVIYKSPDGVLGAVPADMEGEAIKQKYIKATPEEAIEFRRKDALLKSRKNAASPIPNGAEQATDAVDFETQVAENISKVVTPSPEERARIYGSIGPDPRFEEAQSIFGQAMTAAEQFLGGASANIIPDLISVISPEYGQRRALREAANPRVASIADTAGIILPSVGTIAKAAGYAGKGAAALEKAAKFDFFNKALESLPAQKLYKQYLSKILGEEQVGKALDEATLIGEEAAQNAARLASEAPEVWRSTLGKVLQKDADDIAFAAGQSAFEREMIPLQLSELEKVYVSKLEALGTQGGVIESVIKAYRRGDPVVKAAIEGAKTTGKLAAATAIKAAPTAVATGVYGGLSQGLESAKNAVASGEDVSTQFWGNLQGGGETGFLVGGAIAAGAPSILKLGGDIVKGANAATQLFSQKVVPKLGSIFTRKELAPDIEKLLKASPADAQTFDIALEKMSRDLTTEFNRGKEYYKAMLDRFKQVGIVDEKSAKGYLNQFNNNVKFIEDNYMTTVRNKKVFDRDKLGSWAKNPDNWDRNNELVLPSELEEMFSQIKLNESFFTDLLPTETRAPLRLVTEELETLVDDAKQQRLFLNSVKEELQGKFPTATGDLEVIREMGKGLTLQQLLAERMQTVEKAGLSNPFAKFGLPYVGAAGALGTDLSIEGAGRAAAAFGLGQAGKVVTDVFINPAETIKLMYDINRYATRTSEAANRGAFGLFTKTGKKLTRPLEIGATEFITKPVVLSDKEERETFFTERDKLNALSDPTTLTDVLDQTYGQLEAVSPEMAKTAKDTTVKSIQFLRSKLPPVRQGIDPTGKEIKQFNKFYRYVKDPDGLMEEMGRTKFVSDDGLEVLQTLYPSKLKQMRVAALEALSEALEAGETIDAKTRYNIDKVLGQKTTGFTNAQIKKIQESMRPTGGNTSGGSGKLPKLEGEGLPR